MCKWKTNISIKNLIDNIIKQQTKYGAKSLFLLFLLCVKNRYKKETEEEKKREVCLLLG